MALDGLHYWLLTLTPYTHAHTHILFIKKKNKE